MAGRLRFRLLGMAENIQAIDDARTADGDKADVERPRVYCIVGLGNPGPRYEDTPHNMGFLVVDRLAERNRIRIRNNEGMALTGKGQIHGRDVVILKPQTFMNRSGLS